MAVGKFDRRLLFLVFVNVLLLALLGRRAGLGFKLIGERIDVGAPVGEDVLDGQNLRAQICDLFLQLVACGRAVSEASL